MKYILSLILTFCVFSASIYAAELEQISDFEKAKEYAEENDMLVLAIFTADWCKYCKPLEQEVLNRMDEINDKGYVVCLIDYDSNRDLARQFRVDSVPTTIRFVSDRQYNRKVGYSGYANYGAFLNAK